MSGEAQGPLPREQFGAAAANNRISGPLAQRWVLGEARAEDGLEGMLDWASAQGVGIWGCFCVGVRWLGWMLEIHSPGPKL